MAASHNLDEINQETSQGMLHVYKGQRAFNDLVANLCEEMLNLDMHDKLCGHMQALLYDPTSLPGVGELEGPPCKTLIPPSLRHEEKHDGMVMMYEDSSQGHI